jgi:hypothetical protein
LKGHPKEWTVTGLLRLYSTIVTSAEMLQNRAESLQYLTNFDMAIFDSFAISSAICDRIVSKVSTNSTV